MSSKFYISTSNESLEPSSWDYNQSKYLWQLKNHSKNAESSIYYDHDYLKITPE